MRSLLSLLLALLVFGLHPFHSAAQSDQGIRFEHTANWQEVLDKAKKEGRYIFVDAYTTWCGPCKFMTSNIFPEESVGAYFNANFVNVKVQLDTTKKDDAYVKSWYSDAHHIMTNYDVKVFPTYLFLDPSGKLVHRAVGASDAEVFIGKGKDALNPETQYYTLKRRFEAGDREPGFLKRLALAATTAYDSEDASVYSAAYLATQKDLLTTENIEFLCNTTQSKSDTGFSVMMQHPTAFNAVKGKAFAESTTRMIVVQEEILPILVEANEVDWKKVDDAAKKHFAPRDREMAEYARVFYYQNTGEWASFATAIGGFMQQFGQTILPDEANSYAWSIFQTNDNPKLLDQAAQWALNAATASGKASHYDTYANLLYKAGKKDLAIKAMEKAISISKAMGTEDLDDLMETLEKIKRGEKTWE